MSFGKVDKKDSHGLVLKTLGGCAQRRDRRRQVGKVKSEEKSCKNADFCIRLTKRRK